MGSHVSAEKSVLCACQEGCGQNPAFLTWQNSDDTTDVAASDLAAAGKGMLEQEHLPTVGKGEPSRHPELPEPGAPAPRATSRKHADDGALARSPASPPPPLASADAALAAWPVSGDGCLEQREGCADDGSPSTECGDPLNKAGRLDLPRFEVQLSKETMEGGGKSYGLAHVPMEDGSSTLLVVDWREGGPVSRWNQEQQELGLGQCALERGDRVVCVNGQATDLDGMRALLREDEVHFTVERWPQTVDVLLQKRAVADKYGMQTELFQREDGTQVLLVRQIWGGLLGEWNQWACMSRRFFEAIVPGSEIVRVADLSGCPDLMQEALVDKDSVDLTFRRPDPSTYR